jgi:hypothetical protein
VRFDSIGGLSQPRRDTADPKKIQPRATEQIPKARNINDFYCQVNNFSIKNLHLCFKNVPKLKLKSLFLG